MYSDTELWNEIQNTDFKYVYKNEMYFSDLYSISNYDVVYFVSDIWNNNRYIYACNTIVSGKIQGFSPSKVKSSSIKINNQTYEVSKCLDKTRLKQYYTGCFMTLYLGIDGKVVNIN